MQFGCILHRACFKRAVFSETTENTVSLNNAYIKQRRHVNQQIALFLNVLEHNKRCSALSNENLEVLITRISLSRLFSVAAFAPTALRLFSNAQSNESKFSTILRRSVNRNTHKPRYAKYISPLLQRSFYEPSARTKLPMNRHKISNAINIYVNVLYA